MGESCLHCHVIMRKWDAKMQMALSPLQPAFCPAWWRLCWMIDTTPAVADCTVTCGSGSKQGTELGQMHHTPPEKKKNMLAHAQTHTNTTNSPLQWLMSVWTLSNAPLYRWLIVTGREALGVNLWFVKMRNCESVASCGNMSQRERKKKSEIPFNPSHIRQGSILIMHTAAVYGLYTVTSCANNTTTAEIL